MSRDVHRAPRHVSVAAKPPTREQERAIEAGRGAIRRGDYVTLQEAEAYVARERAQRRQGGHHEVPSR
jgi:hypothetical protein